MKEEELWNTDLKALMDLDGTDEMWITPGLSPLIGSKGSVVFFPKVLYTFYNSVMLMHDSSL